MPSSGGEKLLPGGLGDEVELLQFINIGKERHGSALLEASSPLEASLIFQRIKQTDPILTHEDKMH